MATLGVFCGFVMTNLRSANEHCMEFSGAGFRRMFVAVPHALQ
jgi:hypothetical protein